MNPRIAGLAAIAVMLTVLAFQLPKNGTDEEDRLLVPSLADTLDTINRVELSALDDGKRVSLVRAGSGWVVENRQNYPASFEKLGGFLVSLSELKIIEDKTANPDNHGRLGLRAGSGEGGVQVLLEPGTAPLVFGISTGSRGTFFRFADDDQTYLVSPVTDVSTDWLDWVDPVIINIDPESVNAVTVATRSAAFLSVTRDPETREFKLDELPTDRSLKYPAVLDSLGRMLVNLRFLDAVPYEQAMFEDPGIVRVSLDTGETVTVQTINENDEYWIHVDTPDRQGWQYRVNEYNYDELNKTLEDLLAPVEEQE